MAKKFLFNPIIGSYGLLNKSFNALKTKGNETLLLFREFLEDDDIRILLHVKETEFESLEIEIFDLTFLIQMEIELAPEFNTFKKGFFRTYFAPQYGEIEEIGINYKFDQDGRIFKWENDSVIPDYTEMSAFVLNFIELLIKHITDTKYVTIPNQTFEA
ncbi:MAG: hypothetical protein H7329_20815 [Opitutaceae bacterium]|nr:hypothetical protein [Cytophagales bacterium]